MAYENHCEFSGDVPIFLLKTPKGMVSLQSVHEKFAECRCHRLERLFSPSECDILIVEMYDSYGICVFNKARFDS